MLGSFPLPVEVIPMAARAVKAKLEALGATVKLRNFVTDNGCHILDASGLRIEDPKALEAEINAWPGVVTASKSAARPPTGSSRSIRCGAWVPADSLRS